MNKRELAKEKSQHEIVATSMRLSSEYGYNGTSIRMIAKEADISLGLLYNYFSGKEGLIEFIFDENTKEIISDLKKLGEGKPTDFGALILGIFQIIDSRKEFWRLVHSIKMQEPLNLLLQNQLKAVQEKMLYEIKSILKRYNLVKVETEALLLYSVLDGVIQNYLSDQNYPKEEIIDLLIFKYSKFRVSAA